MTTSDTSTTSRVDREAEFHDQRFHDDSVREPVAKYYQAASEGQHRYRELVGVAGTGRVLEYGCGLGSEAFSLAKAGASVTAIDISGTAIDIAARRASAEDLDIAFIRMNAEELEFGEQSFDLICGSGILHHLDIERAAGEIGRVTADGGRAVFLEPMGYNPLINLYRRRTPAMRSSDEHPLKRHDLAALESACRELSVSYHGLLSLASSPLIGRPGGTAAAGVLRQADRGLLSIPGVRLMAWMVVIEMRF